MLHAISFFAAPNIVLADPCIDRIPAKLQQLLHQHFANERLPIAIDSAEDNRLGAKKEGECLLDVQIDLDGDGCKPGAQADKDRHARAVPLPSPANTKRRGFGCPAPARLQADNANSKGF